MISITAPLLDVAVLVLGMLILLIEAFAVKFDKRLLAYAAITGLLVVLVASFFVTPFPSPGNATVFGVSTQQTGWRSSSNNSR